MDGRTAYRFDPHQVATPSFVVDLGLIRRNLNVLAGVKERTGCKILLALKGFAMWSIFPVLREVLDGVCASSPHEARLGSEEFGREVHAFAAGYSQADIFDLCATADHIVFNSFFQLEKFRGLVAEEAGRLGRDIELGVRINPEHSEGAVPIYDPCSPGSRLGVRRKDFRPDLLDGVTGLHWHNLCEQNSDCLERTIAAAEKGFGEFFGRMEYVNFGGGHHITRPDYDVDLLCRLV
jgi:carboxynorspermidine decarboxylase